MDLLRVFLERNSIWHEFMEKQDTATAHRASQETGIPLEHIVKSLVFLADGNAVLIILNAHRRVSRKKLRQLLHADDIRLADQAVVKENTGYDVGAVPPIGHRERIVTVVDAAVLDLEDVWAGGGATNRLVHLKTSDIIRHSNARIADVSE